MEKDVNCLREAWDTAVEAAFFARRFFIDAVSKKRVDITALMDELGLETEEEREAKIESRTKHLSAFPREKEILKEIFAKNRQLKVEDLIMIRKDYGMSGLPVFLEFQHRAQAENNAFDGSDTSEYVASYVYYDESCEKPDHKFGSKRWDIKNAPKATVLLRIDRTGGVTELHRWNDKQEA